MKKKFPEYEINGIGFYVDVDNSRLIEINNAKNCWNISEMFDHGTGYTVNYNLSNKKMDMRDLNIEGSYTSYIPYLTQMDAKGMARKYGVALSVIQQRFKKDLDVMLESKDLLERIRQGKQPVLDINGQEFFVNIRTSKLELREDPLGGISFNSIRHCSIRNESAYRITYDPKQKRFVDIDLNKLSNVPGHYMVVEFPNERILDPVGYARDYKQDLRKMLMTYGFEMKRKADIILEVKKMKETLLGKVARTRKVSRKR